MVRNCRRLLILCLILSHFSVAFAQEFRYDSHGQRDPFLPPAQGTVETIKTREEIHLEGIVFDPNQGSVAIVNGQMIKEGDSVAGLLLVKLEENKAVFERDGEAFEIVLNKDNELMKQYLANNETNQKPDTDQQKIS